MLSSSSSPLLSITAVAATVAGKARDDENTRTGRCDGLGNALTLCCREAECNKMLGLKQLQFDRMPFPSNFNLPPCILGRDIPGILNKIMQ